MKHGSVNSRFKVKFSEDFCIFKIGIQKMKMKNATYSFIHTTNILLRIYCMLDWRCREQQIKCKLFYKKNILVVKDTPQKVNTKTW